MKNNKNLAKLALGAFLITSTSSVSADQGQFEVKGWSETQGTLLASSCGGNGCGGRKVADNSDNTATPVKPTNGCNAKNNVKATNNKDATAPQNYSSGCGGSSPTRPSNGCNGTKNTNNGSYANRPNNNNRNQYLSDNLEEGAVTQPLDEERKAEDLQRQKQLKDSNITPQNQNPSAWNTTNSRGY